MGRKFELRRAALGEIAKSKEVGDDLDRRARAIAAAAGPGYKAAGGMESRRERASVNTVTYQARADNARHGTLLRALEAGRD
jgi:hypothetical protein